MKKAVITGATSMIGLAVIKECIKNNVEVYAFVRKNSKKIDLLPKSNLVNICYADISDLSTYEPDIKDADVFYHFAWDGTTGQSRNDVEKQYKNIGYTLDAVMLAKRFGCHTFIGAGSQAEHGLVEGLIKSDTPTNPVMPYGMAKLCAGQLSRVYCMQHEIKHIWVRILSIYGPHDGPNTMVMSTINKLLAGETPKFTKGEQMWDYLYVGDAANALFLLGDKGKDGKIYPLGSGKVRPLADYIKDIRDIVAPDAELGLGEIPYAENQVMHLCADVSELNKDTYWEAEIEFKMGINNTVILEKNIKAPS